MPSKAFQLFLCPPGIFLLYRPAWHIIFQKFMNDSDFYHSHARKQKCVDKIQDHRQMLEKQIQKVDT